MSRKSQLRADRAAIAAMPRRLFGPDPVNGNESQRS